MNEKTWEDDQNRGNHERDRCSLDDGKENQKVVETDDNRRAQIGSERRIGRGRGAIILEASKEWS